MNDTLLEFSGYICWGGAFLLSMFLAVIRAYRKGWDDGCAATEADVEAALAKHFSRETRL